MSDIQTQAGHKALNSAIDVARHELDVAESDVRKAETKLAETQRVRDGALMELASLERSLDILERHQLAGIGMVNA